ncbi:MAG: NupC/NupG family nucleoside CNT transporter [Gammaproteobacteria bacterium]|nr:NupC/NupG family nucleoside CNT transporter [Gammaproteobacteria bacterium]
MERTIGLVGIGVILAIAYFFSTSRKNIPWRTVFWGFGLQITFMLVILKTSFGRHIFEYLSNVIVAILNSAEAGAGFIFGKFINLSFPVMEKTPEGHLIENANFIVQTGFTFAFRVLPTIIFFASLMAVLYHLGIMQRIIQVISKVMEKTMKTTGAESLVAASNIFVGQTEAPLIVKPYLASMTKSELMVVMTSGFATIAGSVMAAYVGFLSPGIPNVAGHLLAASIMAAPAALLLSKIFVPETEAPQTITDIAIDKEEYRNVIDAATRGALTGMHLSLNIAAMVIAFISLVALVNIFLGALGGWFHMPHLSLSFIVGKLLSPFAYLLGIEWKDATEIGNLLGTKLMINEFVAYLNLKDLVETGEISERSRIIATYALCGFANIGSIGIQLGGLGALAPGRRHDLAELGVRAMFAGAFASCITACLAGIMIG